jgi:hypothetical protein
LDFISQNSTCSCKAILYSYGKEKWGGGVTYESHVEREEEDRRERLAQQSAGSSLSTLTRLPSRACLGKL